MKKQRSEKGTILVLVIGVLAILSLMAATLVTVVRLQADMTRNYADEAQLELLALSALENAIGKLVVDRNTATPNDYDSTTEDWYQDFIGTDIRVFPLSDPSNSAGWAQWINLTNEDGNIVGKYALKIIDQSALIYANESTSGDAASYAQYNAMTGGTAADAYYAGDDVVYPVVEMVKGVDTDVLPYYFATRAYLSDSTSGGVWAPVADAPLNLNTHLEMFQPSAGTMMAGIFGGSSNITATNVTEFTNALHTRITGTGPFTATNGLADVETTIATTGITAGAHPAESLAKNDAMNILINFTGGTDIPSPNSLAEGSTYRAANESYSNYNFNTSTIQGIDATVDDATVAATSLTSFIQTIPDHDANNETKDKGSRNTTIVRREICFKSSTFEIWGIAQLNDYVNGNVEIPGTKAFVAIVDRGINPGDGVRVRSFRWLPSDYMDKYSLYYE